MKNKKVSINMYINLIIAVIIMAYFIAINFAYYQVNQSTLLLILKILSMSILAGGIILLEVAFRKDNGKIGINAIETLVVAAHTLSVAHIVEIKELDFATYILISSYIISIYYLFKAICIYTKEKKEYLNSLSDIKEIVSNEPIKKEATKKGVSKQ